MEIAKVKVTGTRAETIEALDIPEGIVGATVSFEFGPEWAGLTKNVVFVGAKDVEILNIQDSVYLPPEVASAPNIIVKVGIVGVDANKKMVIPTLWADLGTVKPSAPVGMGYEPTLPIWAQLLGMIGNLRELDTEAKDNLVAAINEVKRIAEENDIDIDLSAYVKSVNGVQPDPVTGNVAIEIPRYTLPIAGAELGGVKNGGNVVINEDGTMTAPGSDSGQNPYELPIATAETLGGVMPVAKTEDMTQPVGVDENGQLYTAPGSGGSDYTLPVGGAELGGVKNGGNVTINADGTMTAPESEVTDEQVATAVSDWLEANPDATTTVQDESITREKIANTLLEELGLEPNHHLTEERVEWGFANWMTDETWIEPKTSQSNQMITPLIRMPQYLKIVNNTGGGFGFKKVRITDSGDYNTAVEQTHRRESKWMCNSVANGETLIIPTNECGDGNCAYLQLLANWTYNTAQEKLEIYAIYDTYRRVYEKPNDDGIFLKDLPMRWVVQGYLNNSQAHLYCVVPYYPECTYSIKGGAYINTNVNYVDAHYLFDDAIFDGYEAQFVPSGTNPAPIPYLCITAQQYDNSVNGGANAAYRWAYLTTPSAKEITPKWIAFDMQGGMDTSLDDDGRAAAIQAINDGTQRNLYVTRWAEQLPRKIFTQVVKANPSHQSDGTLHRSLYQMSGSPPCQC